MDINIGYKDFKNIGGFKTRVLKQLGTGFDKHSFTKLNSLLDKVTDTLYLSLSRGIRMPAHVIGQVYYDQTDNNWHVKNPPYNSLGFLIGVDPQTSGAEVQFLDITVNSALPAKSDVSAIYFVTNTSDTTFGDVTNDYVLFPRIDSVINDNTVRVALECAKDSSWGYYEEDGAIGIQGMRVSFEGLYQSAAESADSVFYTPGIPYFELKHISISVNSLRVSGYTYVDMEPDITRALWPTKIRTYAQEWVGDCSSGDGTGDYFYSSWESAYTAGLHEEYAVEGLTSETLYKIWVQINSKVGPDAMDGTVLGCYTTKPTGDDPYGGERELG